MLGRAGLRGCSVAIQNLPFGARVVRCLSIALLFALGSCSVDNVPSGGLVVALETDLAVPKDVDRVLLEASQGGRVFFSTERAIGEGHDLMPLQLRVSNPGNDKPVLVRAIAFRGAQPIIERSAITPMPATWLASVRLPLNFLCAGQLTPSGESKCGSDQTCKQGQCAEALLPPEQLLRYEPDPSSRQLASSAADGGVDAGLTGSVVNASDRCFDVASCFYSPLDIEVEPVTCSFALPPSVLPESLNIALRLPLGQPGVCENGSCFVVLDADAEGYQVEANRVYVPVSVCDRMLGGDRMTVALGLDCPKKTLDNPVCGAWTAVKTPLPTLAESTDGVSVGSNTVRGSPLSGACSGVARQACGLCGTQARDCRDGSWSTWAMCMSAGACAPGTSETCPTGGKRTCGGDCMWGPCMAQTCMGPSSRTCGNCGTQTRSCVNGIWADWSACTSLGVCAPNTEQPCGTGGTQVCGGSCQWGACSTEACPGPASESCGNCGTRTRTCDAASGRWSEWGPCQAEGACAPDSTRVCGLAGMQTCRGDCQWGEGCANQMCEGESERPCGNCGTQTRTCNTENATWSEWSVCTEEGECAPNATRACGNRGLQVCGGNCRWDPTCSGQRCEGSAARSCGNCGIQVRLCNGDTGQFPDWSTAPCLVQGECAANTTRACGNGGKQFCGADCRWQSGCGEQMCPGRAPTRACGNCGTQSAICDGATGTWTTNYGECTNQGVCKPNDTMACEGGLVTCNSTCRWGTCEKMCNPSTRPTEACGNCGKRTVTCDTTRGEWVVGQECSNQGECSPNMKKACAGGQLTCDAMCRWGTTCTPVPCTAPKPVEPCGTMCGTKVATCDPNDGMWDVGTACENQGACVPKQTKACTGGLQTCEDNCMWGTCKALPCTKPKPMEPCGMCGVKAAECNPNTGDWVVGTACEGQGECSPEDVKACTGGRQVCSSMCRWSTCTAIPCTKPKPMEPCGNMCGTKAATCNPATGEWDVSNVCEGEGECRPEATKACTNGQQTCSRMCRWGACEALMCPPPKPAPACGNKCGKRPATCNPGTGEWVIGTTCEGEGACVPDTSEPCPTGRRTCGDNCMWGSCQAVPCTGAKPQVKCGNCGTLEAICNPNGEWVTGTRCLDEGQCEPDGGAATCGANKRRYCTAQCNFVDCPPLPDSGVEPIGTLPDGNR